MTRSARQAIRFARSLGRIFWAALVACFNHRASSKAAALAFYTLLSVAPILVLVVAAAGLVFGAGAARGELAAQWQQLVGPTGASAIQQLVVEAHLSGSGGLATSLAAALLAVGATSVFAELKDSLDELWQVRTPATSGLLALLRARVLSFGLVLVLSVLLLASLVVSAALALLARWWSPIWASSHWLFTGLTALAGFAVIVILFAVIYKLLPDVILSWRDVAIGALCTASLFSLGKSAIGTYLGHSGITSTFGAAGSMAALLIWVYYSAQIFFLGAEFTRIYAQTFGSLRTRA